MADQPQALSFDTSFRAAADAPAEVLPGVLRITAGNAGPFTFTGTNTFLIGHDSLVVMDPGPDEAKHREALLTAIGDFGLVHVSHRGNVVAQVVEAAQRIAGEFARVGEAV